MAKLIWADAPENKKPNRSKLRFFLMFVGNLFHSLQTVGIQTQQTIEKPEESK